MDTEKHFRNVSHDILADPGMFLPKFICLCSFLVEMRGNLVSGNFSYVHTKQTEIL